MGFELGSKTHGRTYIAYNGTHESSFTLSANNMNIVPTPTKQGAVNFYFCLLNICIYRMYEHGCNLQAKIKSSKYCVEDDME